MGKRMDVGGRDDEGSELRAPRQIAYQADATGAGTRRQLCRVLNTFGREPTGDKAFSARDQLVGVVMHSHQPERASVALEMCRGADE